jgi:GDP-mannose 6-dehydrogenase
MRETSAISDFHSPPYLVVGAISAETAAVVFDLFESVDAPQEFVSFEAAECLKLAANAFHATKVAFANEINRFCESVGVSGDTVMGLLAREAGAGNAGRYLTPGFAFGGSCLTKDLQGLLASAQNSIDAPGGHFLRTIQSTERGLPLLAGVLESNDLHCQRLVDYVVLQGWQSVLLVGMTFKPHSSDFRGSPYVEVAQRLLARGVEVFASDNVAGKRIDPLAVAGLSALRWVDPREIEHGRIELVIVGSESHEVVADLRQRGVPVLVAADSALLWPANALVAATPPTPSVWPK